MLNASDTPASAIPAASSPSSLCVFSWLGIQTGAIVLAAMRIPLWAHAPAAGEFLAVEILLSVQILGSALLFPKLADGGRATVVAIATAWPFAVLAGLLAAMPVFTILIAGAYATGWLLVLSIWRSCCSTQRMQMLASAIASTWSAAGPVLLFVRAEYGLTLPQPPTAIPAVALGPLSSALTVIDTPISSGKLGQWICLAIPGMVGVAVLYAKRAVSRQSAGPSRTSC